MKLELSHLQTLNRRATYYVKLKNHLYLYRTRFTYMQKSNN